MWARSWIQRFHTGSSPEPLSGLSYRHLICGRDGLLPPLSAASQWRPGLCRMRNPRRGTEPLRDARALRSRTGCGARDARTAPARGPTPGAQCCPVRTRRTGFPQGGPESRDGGTRPPRTPPSRPDGPVHRARRGARGRGAEPGRAGHRAERRRRRLGVRTRIGLGHDRARPGPLRERRARGAGPGGRPLRAPGHRFASRRGHGYPRGDGRGPPGEFRRRIGTGLHRALRLRGPVLQPHRGDARRSLGLPRPSGKPTKSTPPAPPTPSPTPTPTPSEPCWLWFCW